ncbi:unnamed protein product [Coffea canephora]|uniref:Uncharacterized protein n=1 Tax=Coffea canephora TaxID=49390 RepID=A0A068UP20_COFCA|nr:unnamed protein product [Coffea canephora]
MEIICNQHRRRTQFNSPAQTTGAAAVLLHKQAAEREERMIIIRNQRDYTDQIIKGIILVMLTARTDTLSMTIEWTLSLLLNHPKVLEKARAKLDAQVGIDRLVDEHDLSNLPYLHNIILETLRLYPVAPMLVPHESSDDCKIGGYNILRGTILLLIQFGMGRRSYPGSGLTQRVVGLALGSLIQSFDWKRIGEEEIDLAEGTRVSMPKAKPLEKMSFGN